MKVFFFLFLLINIVFFLWEFNSKPVSTSRVTSETKEKQILLLSELPEKELSSTSIIAKNDFELHQLENVSGLNEMTFDAVTAHSTKGNNLKVNEKNDSTKLSLEKLDAGFLASVELNSSKFKNETIESNALRKFFNSIKKQSSDYITVENSKASLDIKSSESLESAEVKNQDEAKLKPELLKTKPLDNKGKIADYFCYQVGPFLTQKKLNKWVTINKIDMNLVTPLSQDIQTVSKYLVYYPADETYAQSKNNVQLLKTKGVSNYWLFRKGELKGAFSLGLFIKEKRALSLQKKLAKADLNVEVMPRYKTTTVWYAKIFSKIKVSKETITLSDKQDISLCDNI